MQHRQRHAIPRKQGLQVRESKSSEPVGARDDDFGHLIVLHERKESLETFALGIQTRANIRQGYRLLSRPRHQCPLFKLLHLSLQVFFVSVTTDPTIQDDDPSALLSQKPLHFGDGNTRLSPDGDACNLAFFDPSSYGTRIQSPALSHFS